MANPTKASATRQRRFVFTAVAILVAGSTAGAQKRQLAPPLTEARLGAALYCLERDANVTEVRKFSGGAFYKIHYEYLAYDPDLEARNILRLLLVSRNDSEGWYYQASYEEKDGTWVFKWLQSAKMRWKHGEWRVEDGLGGEYHHRWLRNVVNGFYHPKQVTRLPAPLSVPTDTVCSVPWFDKDSK